MPLSSPLDGIAGAYEHAIFVTYSVNFHFFEEWVMPLLRAAGVRNTVVFADETQLGNALIDKNVRGLGRSYHAVSVRLGPGAFHPKLMLLVGDDGVRACISSANLTVDGQLRNIESALFLDGVESTHLQALTDVSDFVRRIADTAPAHTAEAVLAALPDLPTGTSSGPFRVVHNLDEPILNQFPSADVTAVVPYADAGTAAGELAKRGTLHILTDGRSFAAPESFFGGKWKVVARDFDPRRLHGKAYWTTDDEPSWLLLGSPNLSHQALLATARTGNTEVCVVVDPHLPRLGEPPGTPWELEPLELTAPRRHAVEHEAEGGERTAGSFNAWEDDGAIYTSEIPADAALEYWADGAWHSLGTLVDSQLTPPPGLRPYLIRFVSPTGVVRQTIIHRSDQLRIHRLRPRTVSRSADVLSALPLDIAGIQALESVLRDLYLLGTLASDDQDERVDERLRERETTDQGGLTEWRPAREDDEPRVPDIYRRSWANAPDALLALIRGALRLDFDQLGHERDVLEESLGHDVADEEMEAAEREEATIQEEPPPKVEDRALRRYRTSLARLLNRGSEFIVGTENAALGDLGFQAILRLHERLEQLVVDVDGEFQLLIAREELLRQKLALLDAYLRQRGGRDPICLATARVHLAECLAQGKLWTPLEWEQLESLASRYGAILLASTVDATTAARDAGFALEDVDARLRPYADRSEWDGYVAKADERLEGTEFGLDPLVWVSGTEWFTDTALAATWEIIGYGATVGFQSGRTYGVLARNENARCAHTAHALICDPASRTLCEAARRRVDGHWLFRTYSGVSEGTMDKVLKFRSQALADAGCNRSSFEDVGRDGEHDALAPLLHAAAAFA